MHPALKVFLHPVRSHLELVALKAEVARLNLDLSSRREPCPLAPAPAPAPEPDVETLKRSIRALESWIYTTHRLSLYPGNMAVIDVLRRIPVLPPR